MEFFLDNNNTQQIFEQIIKKFKRMGNGEIYEQVKKLNPEYKKIYGINYFGLKQLSEAYEKDILLARKLWWHNSRETKILSILLTPENECNIEYCIKLIKEAESEEILNYCISRLFWKLNFKESLIKLLLDSGKHRNILIAIKTYSQILMRLDDFDLKFFEHLVNSIPFNYIDNKLEDSILNIFERAIKLAPESKNDLLKILKNKNLISLIDTLNEL
ncbi:MAG: hypothetical protein N4A49_12740 [Marinifilaceae bacterium]|jgi:3-methyladenine DNA glycosylase AlkD|nr:hypothetical protein [Marinifilaceae bacterium]